jgi:hypothetical protein
MLDAKEKIDRSMKSSRKKNVNSIGSMTNMGLPEKSRTERGEKRKHHETTKKTIIKYS